MQQVGHFDGGESGFAAFVALFGAGTLNGLFQSVGRDYTVDDRQACIESDRKSVV
jgi:hypothetical protein